MRYYLRIQMYSFYSLLRITFPRNSLKKEISPRNLKKLDYSAQNNENIHRTEFLATLLS